MRKNGPEINEVYLLGCGREKNPCKICFQTVTKRNGLQCHGACKKWVHYKCVGYTPGKIHDIKAGIITIVCPCPDCSTEPKEILVKPPLGCPEKTCPANNFPKCESKECPKNSNSSFEPCFPCECVNPLPPERPKSVESCLKPPKSVPCPPKPQKEKTCKPKSCKELSAKQSKSCSCISSRTSNLECKPIGCKCQNNKPVHCNPVPPPCPLHSSSSSSCKLRKASSDSSAMINALEQMCTTVANLSEQIQYIMCKLNKS